MTLSTWSLSTVATRLLLDLREDGPPATSKETLVLYAFRELIARGDLQVVTLRKRWLRQAAVTVVTASAGPAGPLPPPLDHLVKYLAVTGREGEDLERAIRAARRRKTTLYASDLQDLACKELERLGLAEQRFKKVMRVWPTSYYAPTKEGVMLADDARRDDVLTAHHEALVRAVSPVAADFGGPTAVLLAIQVAVTNGIRNSDGGDGGGDGGGCGGGGCGGGCGGGGG